MRFAEELDFLTWVSHATASLLPFLLFGRASASAALELRRWWRGSFRKVGENRVAYG